MLLGLSISPIEKALPFLIIFSPIFLSDKLSIKLGLFIINNRFYILIFAILIVSILCIAEIDQEKKIEKKKIKEILSIDEDKYCYVNRRNKEVITPSEFLKTLESQGVSSTHKFFYFPYEKQWTLYNEERFILIKREVLEKLDYKNYL